MTETAKQADVVFPACSFAETSGSFTAADGIIRQLNPALPCPLEWDNTEQIKALSAHAGFPMPYRNINDIRRAMGPIHENGEVRPVPAEGDDLFRSEDADTDELRVSFMGGR